MKTRTLIGNLAMVCLLMLSLGGGLSGCKKKSADKKSGSSQDPPTSMDSIRPVSMDANDPKMGMDAMGMDTTKMGEQPDGGLATPMGTKGMMPMKQLEDPTE